MQRRLQCPLPSSPQLFKQNDQVAVYGEAEFDFWKWKTSLELSPQIGFLKITSVTKQAILNFFSI